MYICYTSNVYKCHIIFRYNELTYAESNDHLENPNRGFTMQDSGKASDFTPLDV